MGREIGVGEFIVPPRSAYIGDEVHTGMVTDSGNLIVVAAHHRGHDIDKEDRRRKFRLIAGDRLLLRGAWDALDRAAEELVQDSEAAGKPVPRGEGTVLGDGDEHARLPLLAQPLDCGQPVHLRPPPPRGRRRRTAGARPA